MEGLSDEVTLGRDWKAGTELPGQTDGVMTNTVRDRAEGRGLKEEHSRRRAHSKPRDPPAQEAS